jgi:hypothetical protein
MCRQSTAGWTGCLDITVPTFVGRHYAVGMRGRKLDSLGKRQGGNG